MGKSSKIAREMEIKHKKKKCADQIQVLQKENKNSTRYLRWSNLTIKLYGGHYGNNSKVNKYVTEYLIDSYQQVYFPANILNLFKNIRAMLVDNHSICS